jgi:hypothetical protein
MRFQSASLGLLAVAWAGTGPLAARAQEVRQVPATASCSTCAIRLTVVGRLGGSADLPGDVTPQSRVARDSRGRLYVTRATSAGSLLVFDSTGRYLQSIGRLGSGPGEFQFVAGVAVDAGDSVHVFDPALLRRTVLTPDYHVARTTPLAMPAPTFTLGRGGDVLFSGPLSTPGRRATRFTSLTPTGCR